MVCHRPNHTSAGSDSANFRHELRQSIIQEAVAKVLADAKQGMTIQKFNLDGTPMTTPALPAGVGAPPAAPAK